MATGIYAQTKTPYQTNNRNTTQPTLQLKPEAIPDDYVTTAETVISQFNPGSLTSTKLRKIFGLFVDTYNEVKRNRGNDQLTDQQVRALEAARVRVIYECGREGAVYSFVKQAKLLQYLKSIGRSAQQFIAFYHYMEALVAYHRFYSDNNE